MIFIYDVEIYPNFFCVTFKNVKTEEFHTFIIYDKRNDLPQLLRFINQDGLWLIGYNSYFYDNQIMNYIYKEYHNLFLKNANGITYKLFSFSNDVISGRDTDYKYPLPFKAVDLMKIGALQKSLKSVAVNLNWHKIQDLPILPNTIIEEDQVQDIVDYNINDVNITHELYKKLLGRIKVRWNISNIYNIDVNNDSDSGIANRLLLKLYCDKTNSDRRVVRTLSTHRDMVELKDIIPDYIKFKTNKLSEFLDKLKETYVTKDSAFKKYVVIGNTKYDILKGGLHSNMPPEKYVSSDKYRIMDADVSSYYPNIIINNNIYPEHLGNEFIDVYKGIVERRLEAKKNANIDESEALKITANSTFGKMGNKKHWLYDLKAMYTITIIGQLSLLMLIESLDLSGFDVFYANTDGITVKVEHDKFNEYIKICKKWEKLTKYNLEHVEYEFMAVSTVNDYMSLKLGVMSRNYDPNSTINSLIESGHLKQKGDFITDHQLTKGFDKPIVAEALNNYFLYGKPIRDTIKECRDIYKFCVTKKSDKKFKIEYHTIVDNYLKIVELSKTNRYYMSNKGFRMYKKDKETNKLTEFCTESPVILFNDFIGKDNFDDYNINYNYYINQTEKILLPIVYGSNKLF